MAFAPVDYGPQVAPDDQGLRAMQQATQQHDAVFRGAQQLGSVIEGGAATITQGILHTQSLKATAAVKEQQAQTLQFIDSNPYVDKTALQAKMSKDDYDTWHAGLSKEYQDSGVVPMYTAAGALFDSSAKQARTEASQIIALPGWRGAWSAAEQTESATIRERYVNRLAADQMIADNRAQTLMAVDKMVDGATHPEDIQAAAVAAQTSPWLKPAERRFTTEKVLVAKDSFVAKQAMLAGDTEVMQAELTKLRSDNAGDFFPNMNVKQRLDLANQLGREHSFKASKDVAEKQIVGPNVDENGKVNSTAIAEALGKYNGADKEDVTKAVKVEEAAKLDIFNKKMAEVQQSVLKAGQDPMTGRFSYARAMQDPTARRAAMQLNQDAPGLITALSKEDTRWDNIDSKADAAERRAARAELISTSSDNLKQIHAMLDDSAQSDELKSLTPAQFDTQLYNRQMVETDRQKARAAFTAFQKNGGKPDERVPTILASEMAAAGNGNVQKSKQLMAKYGDKLRVSANQFIRDNPTLPPDKMNEALRAHIRSEMMSGDVLGTDHWLDPTVRRIEYENNPEYAGKSFKSKTGEVIQTNRRSSVLLDEITLRPHAMPRVETDDDYNALPAGTTFTGPDGKTRRKP